MQIEKNPKQLAAMEQFHKGNRPEGLRLQEEFAAQFREEYKDKDHCPCQKALPLSRQLQGVCGDSPGASGARPQLYAADPQRQNQTALRADRAHPGLRDRAAQGSAAAGVCKGAGETELAHQQANPGVEDEHGKDELEQAAPESSLTGRLRPPSRAGRAQRRAGSA